MSLDSFTSAVETNDQLIPVLCEDFEEQFILLPSVLLSKYKGHLTQLQCDHWLENGYFPQPNKRFDVMQNLKVCDLTQIDVKCRTDSELMCV